MAGGSPAASGGAWGVVPRDRWGRLHTGHATRPWPSERGDWTQFYASFARAVRGRGAVPVDPWDAVAGLGVLEAAQHSAVTGQVVPKTGKLRPEAGNRAFLQRAVRFLAGEAGVRQFLDIGTGLPTMGSAHQAAQETAPGSRVAYVDYAPVVVAHATALLAQGRDVIAVNGDLRSPETILADADVRQLIDFSQPVAVLLRRPAFPDLRRRGPETLTHPGPPGGPRHAS